MVVKYCLCWWSNDDTYYIVARVCGVSYDNDCQVNVQVVKYNHWCGVMMTVVDGSLVLFVLSSVVVNKMVIVSMLYVE
jgi:hypothetical protein